MAHRKSAWPPPSPPPAAPPSLPSCAPRPSASHRILFVPKCQLPPSSKSQAAQRLRRLLRRSPRRPFGQLRPNGQSYRRRATRRAPQLPQRLSSFPVRGSLEPMFVPKCQLPPSSKSQAAQRLRRSLISPSL
jgi:hypothetical protein